jgi:hypothetical protein
MDLHRSMGVEAVESFGGVVETAESTPKQARSRPVLRHWPRIVKSHRHDA